ncbi:hypothetical protein T484DRAFT_2226986 [Baffinella frigidus]|nr:hypothetical protein T484DRAFT_2226986 [Cryptophyta sp. CCMP2293]
MAGCVCPSCRVDPCIATLAAWQVSEEEQRAATDVHPFSAPGAPGATDVEPFSAPGAPGGGEGGAGGEGEEVVRGRVSARRAEWEARPESVGREDIPIPRGSVPLPAVPRDVEVPGVGAAQAAVLSDGQEDSLLPTEPGTLPGAVDDPGDGAGDGAGDVTGDGAQDAAVDAAGDGAEDGVEDGVRASPAARAEEEGTGTLPAAAHDPEDGVGDGAGDRSGGYEPLARDGTGEAEEEAAGGAGDAGVDGSSGAGGEGALLSSAPIVS